MTNAQREPADELPPPSAELILIGTLTRAVLRNASKKERFAIMEEVTRVLDTHAEMRSIHRIRPPHDDTKLRRAAEQARAWWRQTLGVLMSGMD